MKSERNGSSGKLKRRVQDRINNVPHLQRIIVVQAVKSTLRFSIKTLSLILVVLVSQLQIQ